MGRPRKEKPVTNSKKGLSYQKKTMERDIFAKKMIATFKLEAGSIGL